MSLEGTPAALTQTAQSRNGVVHMLVGFIGTFLLVVIIIIVLAVIGALSLVRRILELIPVQKLDNVRIVGDEE